MKFYLFLSILFPFFLWGQEPEVCYVTWKDDPTTTIEVFWQVKGEKGPDQIYYQAVEEENWQEQKAVKQKLSPSDIWIYTASLRNLQPDSLYRLQFKKKGEVHIFQTLPATLNRPLKVVTGGDAFYSNGTAFRAMNRKVAALEPDFVIMGGDIAYIEGRERIEEEGNRWYEFFKLWTKEMVTPSGKMIPILPVVGNHDVRESKTPAKQKKEFYQVFAFAEGMSSYRTVVLKEIVFFLLDSGHSHPVKGKQSKWLEQALKSHEEVLYKIPIYHVAAYPSYYPFDQKTAYAIRKHWVPLFEKAGVKVVFENHNHAFKRTFPMKEEKVEKDGIVYLGDGAWGVPPRKPKPYPYLEKSLQTNCVWLLIFTPEACICRAFNQKAKLIDELVISGAAVASAQ